MTYPSSFRKKVLTIKEKEKLSFIEIAGRFSLSKTTIFNWSKRLDPQKHRNKKPIKIDYEALKKIYKTTLILTVMKGQEGSE